ncbi:hypothetical protein ACSYON_004508, partial [Vibrio vulnificus]
CGDFCGESGLRQLGLGGIHPLTQRYVKRVKSVFFCLFALSTHRFSSSSKSALSVLILRQITSKTCQGS